MSGSWQASLLGGQLRRLLGPVIPLAFSAAIESRGEPHVRLLAAGGHLLASATNTYAAGVARHRLVDHDEEYSAPAIAVPAHALRWLVDQVLVDEDDRTEVTLYWPQDLTPGKSDVVIAWTGAHTARLGCRISLPTVQSYANAEQLVYDSAASSSASSDRSLRPHVLELFKHVAGDDPTAALRIRFVLERDVVVVEGPSFIGACHVVKPHPDPTTNLHASWEPLIGPRTTQGAHR